MLDLMSMRKVAKEARQPVQERSATRISKVLDAAARMLEELGPEETSIPSVAEASGVPRAAIYPFFPDKHALFAQLAEMYMEELTTVLQSSKAARARSWQTWVEAAIRAIADYYNSHAAASALLLRGTFAESDHAAHKAKNLAIGRTFRAKAKSMNALKGLPTEPDVAVIAIEIAFACMKYGYAREGAISPVMCREASRAVTAYLSAWDEKPKPGRK
jgi:AcrR family transcriptional regulator